MVKISKHIKNELIKTWKILEFKFLVFSFLIYVVLDQLLGSTSFFTLFSLLAVTISWFLYQYKISKKRKNIFLNFFNYFGPTLLLLFWFIFIFAKFKLTSITIGIFVMIPIVVLGYIVILYFVEMYFSTKLKGVVVTYLVLVLSSVVLFAYMYALLSGFPDNSLKSQSGELKEPWDSIYFSTGTLYAASYGDIYPEGKWIKLLSQIEVIFGAVIHIIILGWIISNLKKD